MSTWPARSLRKAALTAPGRGKASGVLLPVDELLDPDLFFNHSYEDGNPFLLFEEHRVSNHTRVRACKVRPTHVCSAADGLHCS